VVERSRGVVVVVVVETGRRFDGRRSQVPSRPARRASAAQAARSGLLAALSAAEDTLLPVGGDARPDDRSVTRVQPAVLVPLDGGRSR
jgi:hypothetical protein